MSSQRMLWFALIGAIAWGAIMSWEASEYRKPCPAEGWLRHHVCQFSAPIGPLELAKDARTFRGLIDQGNPFQNELWNAEVVRLNTCMDFLFIALYWSVISLLAQLQGKWPLLLVASLISLAAVFDVAENVLLLQATNGIVAGRAEFPVCGAVSEIKWGFFAAALLVLAIFLALTKRFWPVVMSILMIGAAGLTAFGILQPRLLAPAILLLTGALVVAIFLYFPFRPFGWKELLVWVEFAYLIRFQLIAALLLAVVLPAGCFLFPSMFIGLFDALGFWSFVCVAAAALHLAWTVMITVRLVYVYGPDRFPGIGALAPAGNLSWGAAIFFGALAAPCITLMCCATSKLNWDLKLIGIAIGVALATGILWANAKLHFLIEPAGGSSGRAIFPFQSIPARVDQSRSDAGKLIDATAQRLLPGESHPGLLTSGGRVHSGHQLAGMVLGVSIVIYGFTGYYFSPKNPADELRSSANRPVEIPHTAEGVAPSVVPALTTTRPPAALFYLLLLLTNLVLLYSGMAFLLDKVRLPVLMTTLAFSFLLGIFGTDHLFPATSSPAPPYKSPAAAIQAWEQQGRAHGDSQKPIIVVATAGGGIRAGAWTAQVLTGLAELAKTPEHDFSSSLLLVSSVSGGSVGNMYVVGSYGADGRLDPSALEGIRRAAERSSLSAVGWGMAYPDFIRTVPLVGSFLVARVFGEEVDRGSALEAQWLANWKPHTWNKAPTIGEWTKDVSEGQRPVAIFNTTAVETGERYLIASNVLSQADNRTIQFAKKYPQFDVLVSTAARASATFPWVSPNPRLWDGKKPKKPTGVHLADGGYYDNSGILSAIQWLREAASEIRKHPVLFIVIDSTPGTPDDDGKGWSWQRQAVGPLETLLSVRDSSQVSRARFELCLVLKDLQASGIDIQEYDLLYPPDPLSPLSWHLTQEQKDRIHEAWSKPIRDLWSKSNDVLLSQSEGDLRDAVARVVAKLEHPEIRDPRPLACCTPK